MKRTNIAESLTETSQLKQSQIIVKKADQKQPEKQVVASGIRIDSRYLIFIIDNSGSMIEYRALE